MRWPWKSRERQWEWWQCPLLVTPEGRWPLQRKDWDYWMQHALPFGWYILGQPPTDQEKARE